MAEIDPTLLVMLVGSVLAFLGVWYANGHLARKFEKGKKKYEVKLGRYSVVIEGFGLVRMIERTVRLIKAVDRLIPEGDDSGKIERDYSADALLLEYWYSLVILKSAVGLDTKDDYDEMFVKGSIMGMPIVEIVQNDREDHKEKFMNWYWSSLGELMKCIEVVMIRLQKGLFDIKAVGSKDLANEAEKLIALILLKGTGGEFFHFGKRLQIENVIRFPNNLDQLISDFESALAETWRRHSRTSACAPHQRTYTLLAERYFIIAVSYLLYAAHQRNAFGLSSTLRGWCAVTRDDYVRSV